MQEYKDILGNKLDVGDLIAIAHRSGNSSCMKIGKILELTEGPENYWDPQKRKPPILKIQGLDHWGPQWRKQKPSKISLERVIKLHDDFVPGDLLKLME